MYRIISNTLLSFAVLCTSYLFSRDEDFYNFLLGNHLENIHADVNTAVNSYGGFLTRTATIVQNEIKNFTYTIDVHANCESSDEAIALSQQITAVILDAINSHTEIAPYSIQFPLTKNELRLDISFVNEFGEQFIEPNISTVILKNGTLVAESISKKSSLQDEPENKIAQSDTKQRQSKKEEESFLKITQMFFQDYR